jgi:hypothetical protein
MVMVRVAVVYRMTEVLYSVRMEIQLSMAPEKIPGSMAGRVMRVKVLNFDAPRLMAASSVLMLTWCSRALLERMV